MQRASAAYRGAWCARRVPTSSFKRNHGGAGPKPQGGGQGSGEQRHRRKLGECKVRPSRQAIRNHCLERLAIVVYLRGIPMPLDVFWGWVNCPLRKELMNRIKAESGKDRL